MISVHGTSAEGKPCYRRKRGEPLLVARENEQPRTFWAGGPGQKRTQGREPLRWCPIGHESCRPKGSPRGRRIRGGGLQDDHPPGSVRGRQMGLGKGGVAEKGGCLKQGGSWQESSGSKQRCSNVGEKPPSPTGRLPLLWRNKKALGKV